MSSGDSGQENSWRRFVYDRSTGIFKRYYGVRFMGTLAMTFDYLSDAMQSAVLSPMVETGMYAYDSLRILGREQSIEQVPSDTHATYRDRLRDAWDTWAHAGTEVGMSEQLSRLGFPGVTFQRDLSYGSSFDFTATIPKGSHSVTGYGRPLGTFALGGPGVMLGPPGFSWKDSFSIQRVIMNFKPSVYRFTSLLLEIDGQSPQVIPVQRASAPGESTLTTENNEQITTENNVEITTD